MEKRRVDHMERQQVDHMEKHLPVARMEKQQAVHKGKQQVVHMGKHHLVVRREKQQVVHRERHPLVVHKVNLRNHREILRVVVELGVVLSIPSLPSTDAPESNRVFFPVHKMFLLL